MPRMGGDVVLALAGVDLIRDGRAILRRIDWRVRRGERWVVLGPNGSGKTTLCRLASLYVHPSRGAVEVLGERLGRADVRDLRRRLGVTGAAVADMLQPSLRVEDVVVTGRYAALTPWWHDYTADDRERARALLDRFGCRPLAGAAFGALSSGERQRVLLARILMNDPALWLLDEPTAGLDLGGRERLVGLLGAAASEPDAPATVLVTHHVDEIPRGFTHALLLEGGRVRAAGPIDETLTAESLSACFGVRLELERRNGRWLAWSGAAIHQPVQPVVEPRGAPLECSGDLRRGLRG